MMVSIRLSSAALALALSGTSLAAQLPESRPVPAISSPAGPGYADLADLLLASPFVAYATIRSTSRIKGAEAADVQAGHQRFYVEADVTSLIKGQAGVPPRIGYLLDVALDARGRAPTLKKTRVLLFARPVSGAMDQVQLSGSDAQIGWNPATDATVRAIAREAIAPDSPPAIISVGSAFHVPGALPGESETQIFVQAQGGRPVSLSILRRPGEQPRWSVALSEIVDEAAAPPARDTLLWYRLACGLPRSLSATTTGQLEPADATVAQEDYAFVLTSLGPCGRTRPTAASR